jgi:uncharacterized membrane protein YjgN (DUF898 family)
MQNTDPNINETPPEPPFAPALPENTAQLQYDWKKVHDFSFSGNTSEYFGIWIVNILLTIVTLGLYAPWAKVRRLRYFYGNTSFFERRFDFTGVPKKILIGRLIAIGIYALISVCSNYSITATLIGFGLLYFAVPWLMRATIRFNARNSKFGNSRFYFSGTTKEAYILFLKAILIHIFTLGLFFPVLVWLYKKYFLDNLYVGQLKFNLQAEWSDYMRAMYFPIFICIGVFITAFTAIFILGIKTSSPEVLINLLIFFYVLCIAFVWPLMSARLFITTWNSTQLSKSQFSTNSNQWRYAWIVLSNWIARIFTIGLLTPWAAIRLYKYQIESLSLDLKNDPDSMLNRLQEDHSALAEEITDIFDIDISL